MRIFSQGEALDRYDFLYGFTLMATLSEIDIAALQETVFFGSLPEDMFDELVAQSHVVTLDVGQILFQEGEAATAVYAVLEGLVKLTMGRPDGREVMVEMFHKGSSFAEALALSDAIYPVSAATIVESRVLAVPILAVQRTLRTTPDSFKAILSATYRHLHALVRQIEELKGNSGLDRVARYILARIAVDQGQAEMEIPFDKKVLAAYLGIKPESLSRAFRRLQGHGVRVEKGRVIVTDVAALTQFLTRK